ncbi:hypothetical protein Bhyg_14334 [Pseudolycoriella hygida]|uniref:Uncharacterized protein n=1 Tax=Pseudolycoriella hygida TaxID=35572 RepID=A0A9Q0MPN8_9DIPT|nr:hypothetical protein Bhyg_14334 [Pseudolycoriella hygida]
MKIPLLVFLLCLSLSHAAAQEKPKIFKPTVTRTQLRVAKSLNPDDMQELNVKSNNGGFATILVKKRDGKSTNIPPQAEVFRFPNEKKETLNDTYVPTTKLERVDQWQPIQSRSQFAFPTTKSPYRFAEPGNQQSLDLINSFMKHVEQIDSKSRSFDYQAESLKNDRSPVNIAVASTTVPQSSAQLKVPSPVYISSEPVYVKGESVRGESVKRGRSVMSFDSDGIPVVHGVREPDDEQDKKTTWRNARVINGELVPYEKGYKPPRAEPSLDYGQLVYVKSDKSKESSTAKGFGPFTKNDNFADEKEQASVGPFSVEDNLRRELGDNERYDNGFGPFTIYDNAKVANSKLIGYIKKINEKERRRDYFAGRSSRNYESYQDPPQMQRRMLQHPGSTVYSTSMLYTPTQAKTSEKFADGTRTPVLEYAHPELGVQAAKAVPTDSQNRQKFTKIEYYAKNSNFPYSNDPSLVTSEYYPEGNKYAFKNTHTYPYNYGYLRKVKEQPFYLRIAEQMRDSFQNSFSTVHDLTRPVIGPLMEAGHKISKNLGFSKGDEAQEKVGIVATSSGIMPAIGLVAGGAALGLGAMAVGRIFDGNMLRRSNSDDILDAEHKRAIEAVSNGDRVFVVMEQENDSKDESKRLRRSIDDFDFFSENAGPQVIRVKRRGQLLDASYQHNDHTDVIDVIDESGSYSPSIDQILELARLSDQADENAVEPTHSVAKRDVNNSWKKDDMESLLQDIEEDLPSTSKYGFEEQIRKTDWSNTPCAKKVFCEVMLQQSSDDMVLMEKKIDTLLSMVHPSVSESLSDHLSDVHAAIHKRDCSPFVCYQH